MARRNPVDSELKLDKIPVLFLDTTTNDATHEGNNASWICKCGELLIGRCYYQFGDTCYTKCGRKYRVIGDVDKRAIKVAEE